MCVSTVLQACYLHFIYLSNYWIIIAYNTQSAVFDSGETENSIICLQIPYISVSGHRKNQSQTYHEAVSQMVSFPNAGGYCVCCFRRKHMNGLTQYSTMSAGKNNQTENTCLRVQFWHYGYSGNSLLSDWIWSLPHIKDFIYRNKNLVRSLWMYKPQAPDQNLFC